MQPAEWHDGSRVCKRERSKVDKFAQVRIQLAPIIIISVWPNHHGGLIAQTVISFAVPSRKKKLVFLSFFYAATLVLDRLTSE